MSLRCVTSRVWSFSSRVGWQKIKQKAYPLQALGNETSLLQCSKHWALRVLGGHRGLMVSALAQAV